MKHLLTALLALTVGTAVGAQTLTTPDGKTYSLVGPAGAAGKTGATGAPGATGAAGTPGASGAKGATGAAGSTGASGPAGPCPTLGAVTGPVKVTLNSASCTLSFDSSALAATATPPPPPVPTPAYTTWYVRPDGGTHYDAALNPQGQCDGTHNAAYAGSGTNQPCALGDWRLLYDSHQYGQLHWIIAGGDDVIVAQKPGGWRVGFDTPGDNSDYQCYGWDAGPYGCYNPPIPAGTAAKHTRILGSSYSSCSAKSSQTKLFGGYGDLAVLNLQQAAFVDVQCLEVTDNSACIVHGIPNPQPCNTNRGTLDDYASTGLITDVGTHDVALQDLWIHGLTDRGIKGPIGGAVTGVNLDIDKNGMAGWDFDDGNGTASVNATLTLANSVIEWSGCNEELPLVDAIPITHCYDDNSGGYGDGIGTPSHMGMNVALTNVAFRNNTQDGADFGHIDTPLQSGALSTLSITNGTASGNEGQAWKWGPAWSTVAFTGNALVANCARLSAAMAGAPAAYNSALSDFCRANDALSFNFGATTQATIANNSIVTYAPTTFDMQCPGGCAAATLTVTGNLLRGYTKPGLSYSSNAPGLFCGPGCSGPATPLASINRSGNAYFGFASCPANTADSFAAAETDTGESCSDPHFTNEPAAYVNETTLDAFNFAH